MVFEYYSPVDCWLEFYLASFDSSFNSSISIDKEIYYIHNSKIGNNTFFICTIKNIVISGIILNILNRVEI